MSDYLDPANKELLQDFFVEADEQVETLESNILVLETDPANTDALDEIFRAAHTLKGGSATVQMKELSQFTHQVEDTLDAIRSGSVVPSGTVVDALLAAADTVKVMLESRRSGKVYEGSTSELERRLEEVVSQKPLEEPLVEVTVAFREDSPMNSVGGIQVYTKLKRIGEVVKTEPDFDALYEDMFHPKVVYVVATDKDPRDIAKSVAIPDVTDSVDVTRVGGAPSLFVHENSPGGQTTTHVPPKRAPAATPPDSDRTKKAGTGSILRVESRRIDDLMNLVSEIVINKAAFSKTNTDLGEVLSRFLSAERGYQESFRELLKVLPEYFGEIQRGTDPKEMQKRLVARFGDLRTRFEPFRADLKNSVNGAKNATQVLTRVAGELQEGVMQIRMVPVSQVFSRFPRLVRDLSKALGRSVDLVISGEETELDKSVVEDLLDPLVHCVRNSIDHGIEDTEVRRKAGKSEVGTVFLHAKNEGNMIVIEIADDGRGIDKEGIRKKATESGLIRYDQILSDAEIFDLMFEPGLSTASKVTNVSGRGVGLDVVKRQIEKINGTVSVLSEEGEGSRFVIQIPLTLAIIQGLLVKVGTQTYAIPIASVIDSHRIRPEDIGKLDGSEVFTLREEVVGVVRLSSLFHVDSEEHPPYHYVVVVGSGGRKIGLVVDALLGEEDVVIKPLKDQFSNTPGIAGANITGDGNVCLIVDVRELLELGLRQERDIRDAT